MKYQEYLKSAHFTNVRSKALERWDYHCAVCGNPNNLHIHHNNYDCWFKETDKDVVVLCGNCHRKFHNKNIESVEIVTENEKNNNFIAELKDIMTLLDNNLPSLLYYKHFPKISKRWDIKTNPKELVGDLLNNIERKQGGKNA